MSISIRCRCGDSNKTFLRDIGPWFIGECCEEKGYDNHGDLKVGEITVLPTPAPVVPTEKPVAQQSKRSKKKTPAIDHGQE